MASNLNHQLNKDCHMQMLYTNPMLTTNQNTYAKNKKKGVQVYHQRKPAYHEREEKKDQRKTTKNK